MADMEDDGLGAAFTGQKAMAPLQSIMAPAPQPEGGGFLSDPRDRAALLQIGLNLMQPTAIGQTFGGHLAQGIGAGGEAVARRDAQDTKEALADSKIAVADEKLRIAQQNADTKERRGVGRAIGSLTAQQEYTQRRNEKLDAAKEAKEARKEELAAAQRIVDQAESLKYTNPDHPTVVKYAGKTADEVAAMRAGTTGGATGGSKYGPPGTKLKQGNKTYTVGADGQPVED